MKKIRTLFISDVHLGTKKCQADKLLEVFRAYEFENLIIVGDFIDLTSLNRKFYWKEKQKGFYNAYFSAIKLSFSFLIQAIFYGLIFNKKKLLQNLGSFNGTLSYMARLSAFDKNDNPRG